MRIAVFSTKPYDQATLEATPEATLHQFTFLKARLEQETVALASGHDAVCAFVNDVLDHAVLKQLHGLDIKLIVMRCAGFNNVDLPVAKELGFTVARVPEYSPFSVAEHAVGMMLCLNRHLHRAYNRVRERNFALEGLLGFDMHGRTAGVIGTGKIGSQVCRILAGIGCKVVCYDKYIDNSLLSDNLSYASLDEVLRVSDIVTLHCPLTPETHHLIKTESLEQMKSGAMLINTSRGGLLDTKAVLGALKSGKIGYLGLDVYEDEAELFFEDRSGVVLQDDIFARLLTFSNVLITGHQAFFTRDALDKIAAVTSENITTFETTGQIKDEHRVV